MVTRNYMCTQQCACTFLKEDTKHKRMCVSFDWGLCTNKDAHKDADKSKLYTSRLRNKSVINRCMIALICNGYKKLICPRFEGKRKCIFSKGDLCRFIKQ